MADDELKSERVQLLMTPSELKVIDDWSFENRIRGRAEAMRRLCQLGLAADEFLPRLELYLQTHGSATSEFVKQVEAAQAAGGPINARFSLYLAEFTAKLMDLMGEVTEDFGRFHTVGKFYKNFNLKHNKNTNFDVITAKELVEVIASIDQMRAKLDDGKTTDGGPTSSAGDENTISSAAKRKSGRQSIKSKPKA